MKNYLSLLKVEYVKALSLLLPLLIVVLIASIVIWPKLETIEKYKKVKTTLQQHIKSSSDIDSQLSQERKEVETFNKMLHGDMANLPKKQVEAYILGRLQSISWNNQVQLSGVKPSKGEVIQNFQEVLFDVSLVGDYEPLYLWLSDLRQELGFVVIKRFEIRPVDATEQEPKLNVNLTMASYRRAEL